MRSLALSLLVALPLLTGCGIAERFGGAELRINAAVPPDSAVQAARQLLQAQIASLPEAQNAIEPMWSARLRLRALSCSRDYTPNWRESRADIQARFSGNSCLAEQDRALQRWLGLQRVHLMLARPPVRTAPEQLPPLVSHREFISTIAQATAAPVAILDGSSGFDIVELSSGKSLFKEAWPGGVQTNTELSPNGHVFSHAVGGKVSLRSTEGGETLVELAAVDGLLWLDTNVVALRNHGKPGMRLLDLASGDETPIPGSSLAYTYIATQVPGSSNKFNLLGVQGLVQIEIVSTDGRYEARLITEKRSPSGRGFAKNTGGVSADGKTWIDGHQGVRIVDLETLEVEEQSFAPVGTQTALPLPNPQEVLLAMHLPTGDGFTSQTNHYVYNKSERTLARLTNPQGMGTRYVYFHSLKRLALIESQNIRYLDKPPSAQALPASTVVAAFIDEVNQRRLAAVVGQQLSTLPDTSIAAAQAAANAVQAARSAAQEALSSPAAFPRSLQPAPMLTQLNDVQVEGVGVYEGQGGSHGVGKARSTGFVEVRLRRSSRPVALVLSSYEPVRWTIVSEPGSRLAAVFLSGYHESTVIGAGSASVYQIGQSYAYTAGGDGYADLQRTVTRWTGKPISVFQGRYNGASFSVGGR